MFVTRPEIEYFTPTPIVTAAAAEHLAALKPAYKHQLIRGGISNRSPYISVLGISKYSFNPSAMGCPVQ